MKRIAASALWLQYYAIVNPLTWLGYWLIELADKLSARGFDPFEDETSTRSGHIVFRLWDWGTLLEADVYDKWHSRLCQVGYGATLVLVIRVEYEGEHRVLHMLSRAPWQKPFSQKHYVIEHPELIAYDDYTKSTTQIADQLKLQLV